MYTVKEVAELLGISVHTVRYYDDNGLIPGTKRNAANQRLFDDMEVEWLFVSLTLKNTGLSLKEVKRYGDMVVVSYEECHSSPGSSGGGALQGLFCS